MRRLAIPVLAASLLLVSASSVAADDGPPANLVTLDPYSCALYNDAGDTFDGAVPAGSEIEIFQGWLADTRGQVQSYVNNVTWILTVNGKSVDLAPNLVGPLHFDPFWGELFDYSAGTLQAGNSLHTHYDNVLKSASFDGAVHYPKGSVYNGGVDCVVTVSS